VTAHGAKESSQSWKLNIILYIGMCIYVDTAMSFCVVGVGKGNLDLNQASASACTIGFSVVLLT
jgi:hypothetical protein